MVDDVVLRCQWTAGRRRWWGEFGAHGPEPEAERERVIAYPGDGGMVRAERGLIHPLHECCQVLKVTIKKDGDD